MGRVVQTEERAEAKTEKCEPAKLSRDSWVRLQVGLEAANLQTADEELGHRRPRASLGRTSRSRVIQVTVIRVTGMLEKHTESQMESTLEKDDE